MRRKGGARFLLPHRGGASVRWSVRWNKYEDGSLYVDGDVTFGDCGRVACMDFCATNKKDAADNLRKIDRLFVELVKFRAELVLVNEEFNK